MLAASAIALVFGPLSAAATTPSPAPTWSPYTECTASATITLGGFADTLDFTSAHELAFATAIANASATLRSNSVIGVSVVVYPSSVPTPVPTLAPTPTLAPMKPLTMLPTMLPTSSDSPTAGPTYLSNGDAGELFADSYSYSYGSYSYDSADGELWNTADGELWNIESGRRLLSNPTAGPTYLISEDAKELFEDSYSYSYGSYSYDSADSELWNSESLAPSLSPFPSAEPSASPTSLPTTVPTFDPTPAPSSLPSPSPTSPLVDTIDVVFVLTLKLEDYGIDVTNSTTFAKSLISDIASELSTEFGWTGGTWLSTFQLALTRGGVTDTSAIAVGMVASKASLASMVDSVDLTLVDYYADATPTTGPTGPTVPPTEAPYKTLMRMEGSFRFSGISAAEWTDDHTDAFSATIAAVCDGVEEEDVQDVVATDTDSSRRLEESGGAVAEAGPGVGGGGGNGGGDGSGGGLGLDQSGRRLGYLAATRLRYRRQLAASTSAVDVAYAIVAELGLSTADALFAAIVGDLAAAATSGNLTKIMATYSVFANVSLVNFTLPTNYTTTVVFPPTGAPTLAPTVTFAPTMEPTAWYEKSSSRMAALGGFVIFNISAGALVVLMIMARRKEKERLMRQKEFLGSLTVRFVPEAGAKEVDEAGEPLLGDKAAAKGAIGAKPDEEKEKVEVEAGAEGDAEKENEGAGADWRVRRTVTVTDITRLVQFFPGLSRETEWGTAPVRSRGMGGIARMAGKGKGKGKGKGDSEASVPLLKKGTWGAEGDSGSEAPHSPVGMDDLDLGFASDGEGEGEGGGEDNGEGDGESDGKSPGCYCPPPPFFAPPFPPFIRAYFEESRGCKAMGGCGNSSSAPLGIKRHHWMFTAAGFSFTAFVLLVMSCMAVFPDVKLIKALPWGRGHDNGIHTYVGLTAVVQERDDTWAEKSGQTITFWSGIDCSSIDMYGFNATTALNTTQRCESCKAASGASIATAVVGAVTQLLQINGDIGRSTTAGDLNCAKTVGVLSGIWGLGSTLASLFIFYFNCFTTDLGTMQAGSGFICIVVATCMKLMDIIFHSCLKTPEALHKAGGEEGLEGAGAGGGSAKGRYRPPAKAAIVPDGVEDTYD